MNSAGEPRLMPEAELIQLKNGDFHWIEWLGERTIAQVFHDTTHKEFNWSLPGMPTPLRDGQRFLRVLSKPIEFKEQI